MTRINVGVMPWGLPSRLLLAEHREITRIPNSVASGRAKLRDIPNRFTLGKGHVKFFYPRLGYLRDRYTHLYRECVDRGFNVTNKIDAWSKVPIELMGTYVPQPQDRALIVQRIESKGFQLLTVN